MISHVSGFLKFSKKKIRQWFLKPVRNEEYKTCAFQTIKETL